MSIESYLQSIQLEPLTKRLFVSRDGNPQTCFYQHHYHHYHYYGLTRTQKTWSCNHVKNNLNHKLTNILWIKNNKLRHSLGHSTKMDFFLDSFSDQLASDDQFEISRSDSVRNVRAANSPNKLAVVVAQVVEQWHSVCAGWVQIPGQTWLFLFRIAVYLFSLGVGLSLRMSYRAVYTPSSSSF